MIMIQKYKKFGFYEFFFMIMIPKLVTYFKERDVSIFGKMNQ